jgi:hypothetical protein
LRHCADLPPAILYAVKGDSILHDRAEMTAIAWKLNDTGH